MIKEKKVEEENFGKIIKADISKEMKESYLTYAMSVIVSRALPDVRDGLKPVHRRILYGMNQMGIKSTSSTKKCARIVGDVLGKYHPHGDASVYDALVRMAQDFSLRYPAVKPQGNFGSVDGDGAAAMRYTEAKLSKVGDVMLADLEKNTVDMGPNYDESLQEPLVLPAAFPFLLANGSSGIAVGMATNMAPHNVVEVCQGMAAMIDNPDISIMELMEYIKGPDFPTYGIICGQSGIKSAFLTGKGKIVIRGRYHLEEKKTHDEIVFTEIPYQVNKAELVKRIAELKKELLKNEIFEVRDESDRDGMRLVIILKKGAIPEIVVNHLFKNTTLETNFNVNNLALVNGKPMLLNLKEELFYYIEHRKDVIERRTRFDLKRAEEREHILLGLKIGLDNIDEVIALIKKSESNDTACQALCARFALSEIQSKAIINMRLGKLSHLETQEILDELAALKEKISYFITLLSSDQKILEVVKKEAGDISDTFNSVRRTEIDPHEVNGILDKDFIKKEEVVVVTSHNGFIKRVSAEDYRSQGRGGTGVKGANLRDDDFVENLFVTNSHNHLLVISDFGRAFWFEVYEIPEGSKSSKGVNIRALLPKLEKEEGLTSIICFEDFDDNKYLMMVTKKGVIKRVTMKAFINARKNGIKAIILDEDDQLAKVVLGEDGQEAMVISNKGKGLRFNCDTVRAMGRATHGVRGMKLKEGDEIIGLVKVSDDKDILMITNTGKGKRVNFEQFMQHSRGTAGQMIYGLEKETYLVSALGVNNENDVVCITKNGITIRTHVESISVQGRSAKGVNVVRMKTDDDYIVATAATDYQQDEVEEIEDQIEEVESIKAPEEE